MSVVKKNSYLFSNVSLLKGVGKKLSEYLKNKKIEKINDLLWNLPYSYTDRSGFVSLDKLEVGKISTVKIKVIKHSFPRIRNLPNKITCEDDNGKIDLVYFNRVESGLQVLQRRPFIGLDSIIFLVPIHNKLHMIYILTKTLLNGRLVHVKQFCVVKEGRTFSGFLNNILDLIIYNDLTYRFKSTMYRHTLIKKIIQKVLKY